MRKLLFLTMIILLFPLNPIKAQESYAIASIQIEIWPEFDRPEVLVIYHIQLTDETPLPAQINIKIPAQSEVVAVAVEDPSLGLILADYSQTRGEEWEGLSILATTPVIQIEYYENLMKEGSLRRIEFKWIADISVPEFSVIFQNPVGATNVTLVPESINTEIGKYNLLYHVSETLSLIPGEVFNLSATYEKNDDELSIASLPVEPSVSLEDTPGQINWNSILPWILGGVGIVFIFLGLLVLFGFRGKSGVRSGQKKTRRSNHPRKDLNPKLNSSGRYCNECGRRAEAGDQFCRSCGTHLRIRDGEKTK